jgi:hypothetical protein
VGGEAGLVGLVAEPEVEAARTLRVGGDFDVI